MTVTKFTHSCLLIKDQGQITLADPGEFSWGELLQDRLKQLEQLDYLLLTHEHEDHTYLPAIKQITKMFPDAKVVCGPAVGKILSENQLDFTLESDDYVELFVGKHQPLFEGVPEFENVQFLVGGKLLLIGDSMHPATKAEVLALPFFGPWLEGTFSNAMNLALEVKPKYVIPIHDWHYNSQARQDFYDIAAGFLQDKGITSLSPADGQEFNIQTTNGKE